MNVTGEVIGFDLGHDVILVVVDNQELNYVTDSLTGFKDFINQCTSSSGSVVLVQNYTYNSLVDSDLVNGIQIVDSLTIDGNGYSVSGADSARIFNISGSNVILENIGLINGLTTVYGGAVYWGGSGGSVKKSKFYNNTAVSGSAIYAMNDLMISDSVFCDNLATNSKIDYDISGRSLTLTFSNSDNYINAIYTGANLDLDNVSYWNGTALVNNGDATSNIVSVGAGQVIVIDFTDKLSEKTVESWVNLTDANGKVINTLDGSFYYIVDASHSVGLTRNVSTSFEMVSPDKTVVPLNVVVNGDVYVDSNITITVTTKNDAEGNITFTINGTNYTRELVGGVATLNTNHNLLGGHYNVTVLYNGSSSYHGQMNSTLLVVKVNADPNAYISELPKYVINGTNVTLSATTNFGGVQSVLQFVVLSTILFDHTIFHLIFQPLFL